MESMLIFKDFKMLNLYSKSQEGSRYKSIDLRNYFVQTIIDVFRKQFPIGTTTRKLNKTYPSKFHFTETNKNINRRLVYRRSDGQFSLFLKKL